MCHFKSATLLLLKYVFTSFALLLPREPPCYPVEIYYSPEIRVVCVPICVQINSKYFLLFSLP